MICLVRSFTSSIRLLAQELTEILYLACLLARFFFTWLYLPFVSAWFATALLSMGSRLGSPPRHFYGGGAVICVL